jgi:hypothetical protein
LEILDLPRTMVAIPIWVTKTVLPCTLSCAVGSLGGLVNNVIAVRRKPSTESTSSPSALGWQHGVRADLFFGAVAGLVTFLAGINDVPLPKILVGAIFAGVSGATYFTKTKEVNEARRQVRTGKAKSRALKKVSEIALEPSIKETKDAGPQ